jgi:hypothetical protein
MGTPNKGGQRMRIMCAMVLVVGLAAPARAQDERGWTLFGGFYGSSNTDGTIMKLDPALNYRFNRHFQTYAGLPFYFVNPSSTAISTSTTTATTSNGSGFVSGVGNAFLGFRGNLESDAVNYSSTLELTAPTGDKSRGFSTGRVTSDWTNRFSHSFHSFTPFGSLGIANTISDTAFFVRPFTSLGLVSHFEGGAMYDFSRYVSVGSSAYAVRAAGDQTIISKVIKRQATGSSSAGTSPSSGAAQGAGKSGNGRANRVFDTTTETVVPSTVANDNGVSTWLIVSPRSELNFHIGYSRSMHYDFDTVSFGLGFRFPK